MSSYPRDSYPRMVCVGFGMVGIAKTKADHDRMHRDNAIGAACFVAITLGAIAYSIYMAATL